MAKLLTHRYTKKKSDEHGSQELGFIPKRCKSRQLYLILSSFILGFTVCAAICINIFAFSSQDRNIYSATPSMLQTMNPDKGVSLSQMKILVAITSYDFTQLVHLESVL